MKSLVLNYGTPAMHKLIIFLLFFPVCSSALPTWPPNIWANIVGASVNKVVYLDGVTYKTLAAATAAACNGSTAGEVIIPNGTYPQSANYSIPSNCRITGQGYDNVVLAFAPDGPIDEAVSINRASTVELDHLAITGTNHVGRGVSINGSSNIRVHDLKVNGITGTPVLFEGAGIHTNSGSTDVWIYDNILSGNGPATVNANAYDIANWVTNPSSRIHVLRNCIFGSNSAISIGLYDCDECEIVGNTVDQNNKIGPLLNTGGYGLMVYGSVHRPQRPRVVANQISNTAGAGIYLAGVDGAVVEGNTVNTCCQQETDESLAVGGVGAVDLPNGKINGNTILASFKDGIALQSPLNGTTISSNSIKTPAQYGINLRGAIRNGTVVADNVIDKPTNVGIEALTSVANLNLHDNTVRTGRVNGIQLALATDSNIHHNHILTLVSGSTGILVAAGTNDVIAENEIEGGSPVNATGISNAASFSKITRNDIHDTGTASGQAIESLGTDDSIIENFLHNGVKAIDSSRGGGTFVSNNYESGYSSEDTAAGTDVVEGTKIGSATMLCCTILPVDGRARRYH